MEVFSKDNQTIIRGDAIEALGARVRGLESLTCEDLFEILNSHLSLRVRIQRWRSEVWRYWLGVLRVIFLNTRQKYAVS